ncbi:hypothetical protein ABZ721_11995 [Streptomyces sp. NPDC006733]|uniref:hypothetical protein n=1 Tax=Streptomyces sp. NPDC006733 TaxID=3155460 RepID=UPI0033D8C381
MNVDNDNDSVYFVYLPWWTWVVALLVAANAALVREAVKRVRESRDRQRRAAFGQGTPAAPSWLTPKTARPSGSYAPMRQGGGSADAAPRPGLENAPWRVWLGVVGDVVGILGFVIGLLAH